MANEKRLIDANAILEMGKAKTIIEAVGNWSELPDYAKSACLRLWIAFKGLLMKAPTVDAVEVVRCKDCVNYCGFERCKNGICDVDSVSKRAVNPDDFCSYGERRTDERTD